MSSVTSTRQGYDVRFDEPVQGQSALSVSNAAYDSMLSLREANEANFNQNYPRGTAARKAFSLITKHLADDSEERTALAGLRANTNPIAISRGLPSMANSPIKAPGRHLFTIDITTAGAGSTSESVTLDWEAEILDVVASTTVAGDDVGITGVVQGGVSRISGTGRGVDLGTFQASSLVRGHLAGNQLNNTKPQTWTVRHGAAGTTTLVFVLDRGPNSTC